MYVRERIGISISQVTMLVIWQESNLKKFYGLKIFKSLKTVNAALHEFYK